MANQSKESTPLPKPPNSRRPRGSPQRFCTPGAGTPAVSHYLVPLGLPKKTLNIKLPGFFVFSSGKQQQKLNHRGNEF